MPVPTVLVNAATYWEVVELSQANVISALIADKRGGTILDPVRCSVYYTYTEIVVSWAWDGIEYGERVVNIAWNNIPTMRGIIIAHLLQKPERVSYTGTFIDFLSVRNPQAIYKQKVVSFW